LFQVYWSVAAENRLTDIYDYYSFKASEKIAAGIVNDLIDESIRLENNPFVGQMEELLKDRIRSYRYLVLRNYKLIYWVDEKLNEVRISDVFDCRQNPVKMREIK